MSARERRAKERRLQRRSLARAAAPAAVSGVIFAAALAGAPAPALAASLSVSQVANINNQPAGSDPRDITTVGASAYFSAYKPGVGTELWKSDGTSGGTTLVDDIVPGNGGSYPRDLTNVAGTLYFFANDGSGSQLWKTDGTAAGTRVLTSPDTGNYIYQHDMINVGGTLYFTDKHGQVWKSDGTQAGTIELSSNAPPYANYLTAVGGTVYFLASDQLWKTDGTPAGTAEVAALPTGPVTSMVNVSGSLYFGTSSTSSGLELWKSDGTSAGTAAVKQISSSPSGYRPAIGDLTNLNGALVFAANDGSGTELWKSDGTAGGTQVLADVAPYGYGYSDSELVAANGKLYFLATTTADTHPQLWETDGTAPGTVEVSNLSNGADGQVYQLTGVGNTLFLASNSLGLLSDDGTPGDAVTVIGPSYASYLTNLQGTLLFEGNDGTHGTQLWKSDGTAGGTSMAVNIDGGNAGSNPYDFVTLNGNVYFLANDGTNEGLWKSDGTSGGTTLIGDISAAPPYRPELVNENGELYFTAGGELYKSSGAAGDITAVSNPGGAVGVQELTAVGSTLFFYARTSSNGWGLWKSDGTTVTVVDGSGVGTLTTGATNFPFGPTDPLVAGGGIGGIVYFSGTDGTHGWELWKTDGTTAGTQMVKDIDPGTADSSPQNLTNVNGVIYFAADDGTHGTELWKSDGTASGTQMVDDIVPGALDSSPGELTNVGGTLYFDAQNPADASSTSDLELWKTDGTQAGTQSVKDLGVYGVRYLTNVNGELYFVSKGSSSGEMGLWKSDGTTAGSQLVADIGTTDGNDYPSAFTNFNGTLVFVNNDGTHGYELWQSDGMAAGTQQVADIDPGLADGVGSGLFPVGSNLFFSGNDGANGYELWKATAASTNGGGGSGGTPGSGPGGTTPGSGNGPPATTGNGIPSLKFTSTKVSGDAATIKLDLPGTTTGSYTITVTLSVVEIVEGNKVLGVAASDRTPLKKKQKPVKKTVVVGTKTVTVDGGQTKSLSVALNGTGRKLLALRHHLSVKLTASDKGKTLASKTLSFKASKKK
jgi:ELWxxDGT repeat protein